MAEVKFYLKNPSSDKSKAIESKPSLIYLFFSFDGMRLKYSTSETINPKDWNTENQRAKKSLTGASDVNDWLDKLSEDVKKIYRTLKTNDEKINPEIIRECLNESLSQNKKVKHNLFSFADEYISSTEGLKAKGTIKTQRNTLNRLQDYKDYTGKRIDFDTIDIDFYNSFTGKSI